MNNKLLSYILKIKKASGQYRKRFPVCLQLPVRLWIEPTSRCNLKCIMCPNSNPPENAKFGDMDMGLYRKLIDEAKDFVIDINLFARGESFLSPNIFEMILYAKSNGLRTRLETNATLLSEEKSQKLIECGLDFLSFSIDGYTKQTYEKIRVNANFEKTMNNILDFLKIKKQSGKKNPFVLIQVIEVALLKEGSDRRAKKDFMKKFSSLPINGFRFVTPHRFGGVIAKEITGTSYAYMKEGNSLISMSYTPCPYPWYGMSIYYDGSVLPCCLNFFDNYVIGDANRQSLVDIWNGAPMIKLRSKLARGEHKDISMCKECDFLYQRSLLGVSTKGFGDLATFIREAING